MRELSTDRPDTTESPMSVDAGHTQIETDLVSGYMGYDGRWVGQSVAEINAKLGLLPFADLQVVFLNYEQRKDERGVQTSGISDTTVRLKLNLYGNDGGDFAIGLLPMVTIPTGSKDTTAGEYEYGLAVPMGFALRHDFSLGAMFEGDLVHNEDGDQMAELLQTVTASHPLVGPLSMFVEMTNTLAIDSGLGATGTANSGLVVGWNDTIQFDLGANLRTYGLGTDDIRLFSGVTFRG